MKSLIIASCCLSLYLPLQVLAETRTWSGSVDRLWNNAENWNPIGVPQEGDDVIIPQIKVNKVVIPVIITEDMPRLNSLNITGTLMTSNWVTAVRADTITINKNGILTCGAAFGSDESSNRVWVVCRDITVASGGSISADNRGYKRLHGPGCPGPGDADGYVYRGASHGGHGAGGHYFAKTVPQPKIYGDAETPLDPGSGGNYTGSSGSASGGGAILIEASGTITVNGTITANSTTSGFGTSSAMGAGGSICIRCKHFKGNKGSITAEGACGRNAWDGGPANKSQSYSGGGGRISIKYDPSEQEDGDISNMKISAAPGTLYNPFHDEKGTTYYRSCVVADKYWTHADMGTLWFTDNKPVTDSEGMTISGQLVYTNRFDFSTLNVTSGHFRFAAEETVVNVHGDMNIQGINTRVEFGGSEAATNRLMTTDIRAYKPWTLNVGGNLTIQDGARMDVRSAQTNGTDVAGCYVNVAGDMKILSRTPGEVVTLDKKYKSENTSVYCFSDRINGGSPLFKVGSLLVEENTFFSASRHGFASGSGEKMHNDVGINLYGVWTPIGLGPGGGVGNNPGSVYAGGSHGGRGAYNGSATMYDDPLWPTLAGSGGSGRFTSVRAFGGGVIHVKADRSIIVNGTISADGESRGNSWIGGGAGGSILLECRKFSGAETGVLSAKGGNGSGSGTDRVGGGGGGGRIAVWTGKPWQDNSKLSHCTIKEEPFLAKNATEQFLGTVTVNGGIDVQNPTVAAGQGGVGTIKFIDYLGKPGLTIFIQ